MNFILVLVFYIGITNAKTYHGHKLVSLTPTTETHIKVLTELRNQTDVWKSGGHLGDVWLVRVAQEHFRNFETTLKLHQIPFKITVNDLQKLIEEERANVTRNYRSGDANIDLNRYNRFSEINAWLDTIAGICGLRCSVEYIGSSYQGHVIRAIRIRGDFTATRSVVVVGGLHGLAWLGPATIVWLIDKFARDYAFDTDVRDACDKFDWYFIPLANPDGYEYTFSGDRFWTKNRRYHPTRPSCPGTDLNCNFGYVWGGCGVDQCELNYRGDSAFSESKSQAIRNLIQALPLPATGFFDVDAVGLALLYPWGYSSVAPPTQTELVRVADLAANGALPVSGQVYIVNQAYDGYAAINSPRTGDCTDWAYQQGIPYVYNIRLPDRDGNGGGYLQPESMIAPTASQMVTAFTIMSRHMRR